MPCSPPLHICKSLHGWLVRGQGTLLVVLTKAHLLTNVKKLWTSGRAGVFCGFEGAVWDTHSSLCSGQSHRPTWCILTFSFCSGNFCLLLITNYSCWFNLFVVMAFSSTYMVCCEEELWGNCFWNPWDHWTCSKGMQRRHWQFFKNQAYLQSSRCCDFGWLSLHLTNFRLQAGFVRVTVFIAMLS